MVAEALVIFACFNSTGCTQTSTQYFNTHPEVKEMLELHEKNITRKAGPFMVKFVGPLMFAAAGGTGTIRMDSNFSLQANTKQCTLVFGKEW